MNKTKKRTLYIPIEIKNRELLGHLQLASEAVDRGYRVIFGNKPLIYQIINNKADNNGFLLYKGGGRTPELILSLAKKLNVVGVLDQELGVAVRDLKDFFSRRYDPKILSSIDRFYFLGKRYVDAATKIMADVDSFTIVKESFPETPKISNFIKIGRHMPEFLKSAYSKANFILRNPGLRPLADYRQKMPGGITIEECEFFLEKLRDGRKNFTLVKLEKDLMVIE